MYISHLMKNNSKLVEQDVIFRHKKRRFFDINQINGHFLKLVLQNWTTYLATAYICIRNDNKSENKWQFERMYFDDCLDWKIKLSIVVIINLLLRGQEAKIGKYEKDVEIFEYCALW